jgi:asparagine synthase (glutamine-hydrolysing)
VLNQFKLAEARRYLPAGLRPRLPPLCGSALRGVPRLPDLPAAAASDIRAVQKADIETYSVPALTHWEDRNSMAWSREVRNPFLDYRLVSLGVSLPARLKVARGWTKYVLRQAIAPSLPSQIAWRRDKRGFSTPEASLLRGQLRAHVEQLLAPEAEMVRRGLVEPRAARQRFATFLAGDRSAVGSRDIFQLLSLELWLRAYRENLSG